MNKIFIVLIFCLICISCSSTKIRTESANAQSRTGQTVSPQTATEKEAYEHFGLGFEYRRKGELEKAILEYKKAYDTLLPTDSSHAWGAVSNEYGLTLIACERYTEAIAMIKSALSWNTEAKDKMGIAVSHLNLGDAYGRAGQSADAQKHWKLAQKMAEDLSHDSLIKAVLQRQLE